MTARTTTILNNLKAILATVINGNSVSNLSESHTYVNTLSGAEQVSRIVDLKKVSGDRPVVRIARGFVRTTRDGANIGGSVIKTLEISVAAVTQSIGSAASPEAREDAAIELEADLMAAIMSDQGLENGGARVIDLLEIESVAVDGAQEFQNKGLVVINIQAGWHSRIGV